MELQELLEGWGRGDGKPMKGMLIDIEAWNADPGNLSCMCAQGQALHTLAGWSPEQLRDTAQSEADLATAKLLNISRAHAVLLREVNDTADGAPAAVLTHPERFIGDQARTVLAFWLALDGFTPEQWAAARDAARDAAGAAAGAAARDAARDAAGAAARDAAGAAAWAAARAVAWAAAGASNEIQGANLMRERGQAFYFLSLFGFASPEAIPPLPADYGVVA